MVPLDKRASEAPDQAPYGTLPPDHRTSRDVPTLIYDSRAWVEAKHYDRLRNWLTDFADRIERDRREPDKLLIEVTSMRAIANGLRDA